MLPQRGKLRAMKIHAFICSLLCLSCLTLAAPAQAQLPDPARFSNALEMGDLRQAKAWLDAGLDPNFEGHLIGTGLMIGAWEGNLALMELFYLRGADVNRTNRFGETALMHAAWKNRTEAMRWLLDHGARPNSGERQWSALHYAAFAGHAGLADTLIAAGADINARSTNGSTVVMMAAREGHAELAKRLLDAGANPVLKNDFDEDAVGWAMRQGNFDIAKIFASAENFAELARLAAANPAPPPMRSIAAPDRVDELLRLARLAEMDGWREEAMRLYRQAWDELKTAQEPAQVGPGKTAKAGKTKAKPPKGLVIRAKRAAPEQQSLAVDYGAEKANVDIDALLEQARAAESAGRRQEALALFRRAAAGIRSGQ